MAKKTTRKPSKPIVRFVAFSCRHHPLTDESALDWVCEQIRDVKPDYVIDLGDRYEAASASRWPNEYEWELEDEYKSCNDSDAAIRVAAPGATRVCLPGNHDDNLLSLDRLDKGIRGLCDWRRPQFSGKGSQVNSELLNHWTIAAEHVDCRKRGCFRLGQVTFAHGYAAGSNSDRDQAIRFGTPYGLFVSGHTHRPAPVTQAELTKKITLPYWFANAGCLTHLKPDYMLRKNTDQWGHACVVGECDMRAGPAKSPRVSPRWSAETRVLRVYGESHDQGVYEPGSLVK